MCGLLGPLTVHRLAILLYRQSFCPLSIDSSATLAVKFYVVSGLAGVNHVLMLYERVYSFSLM